MADLHPEGNYRGRLVSHAIVANKKKPDESDIELVFDLDFHVTRTGEEAPVQGRAYVSIYPRSDSPRSIEIATEQLQKIGADIRSLAAPADKSTLIGVGCDLYCKHEEYNGETKCRWGISSGGAPKETDMSAAKRLASLFGNALKAPPKSAPKSAPVAAPAASADDDLPF